MAKSWLVRLVVLLGLLATSLFTLAAGPPEQAVEAKEARGEPVKVNGKDMKLWVFVFPEPQGKKPGGGTPTYCTDGDQSTIVPAFAGANPGGLTFNMNRDSIPIGKDTTTEAIHDSFNAWDAVSPAVTYFTVNNTGGAVRPAADGNNTVGWVFIVPTNILAGAWVWVDEATNTVAQADIFYNSFHKWGVFTSCNAEGKYEVGNVGTHEVGHVVALNHLSDPQAYATMYPSAPKGEVRKRTPTTGDIVGYIAVGGY